MLIRTSHIFIIFIFLQVVDLYSQTSKSYFDFNWGFLNSSIQNLKIKNEILKQSKDNLVIGDYRHSFNKYFDLTFLFANTINTNNYKDTTLTNIKINNYLFGPGMQLKYPINKYVTPFLGGNILFLIEDRRELYLIKREREFIENEEKITKIISADSVIFYNSKNYAFLFSLGFDIKINNYISIPLKANYAFANRNSKGLIVTNVADTIQSNYTIERPNNNISHFFLSVGISINMDLFKKKNNKIEKNTLLDSVSVLQTRLTRCENEKSSNGKKYSKDIGERENTIESLQKENIAIKNDLNRINNQLLSNDSTIYNLRRRIRDLLNERNKEVKIITKNINLEKEKDKIENENRELRRLIRAYSDSLAFLRKIKKQPSEIYIKGEKDEGFIKKAHKLVFLLRWDNRKREEKILEIEVLPSIYEAYIGRTISLDK